MDPVDGFVQVERVPPQLVGDLVDAVAGLALGVCVERGMLPRLKGPMRGRGQYAV